MMLTFNKNYFVLTVLIFIVEVVIALFATDNFIRSYFGDVLVVILIYCFVKSFINLPILSLAIGVLLFSFTIEFLQYCKIVNKLGLGKSAIARTVIGTSFAWFDILSYVAGFVTILVVEKYMLKKKIGLRSDLQK